MTNQLVMLFSVFACIIFPSSLCSCNEHYGVNAPCHNWGPIVGDTVVPYPFYVPQPPPHHPEPFHHHPMHHPMHHPVHHSHQPCSPCVERVERPGRIVVKEECPVITEYVEGSPLVLHQEAAPRFVFGDKSPIRLTHKSKPVVIEHFETPYIIDAHQKSKFVNHAASPVVIDHYEAPIVVKDEGLPPVYETCECPCGVPECDGGCGCAAVVVEPVVSAPCPCGLPTPTCPLHHHHH